MAQGTGQNTIQYPGSAVALELQYILSGVRGRRFKIKYQPLVQR
jgi:hypothetical protein